MVVTPLMINIFPWNLHHCTQYRQSYLYYISVILNWDAWDAWFNAPQLRVTVLLAHDPLSSLAYMYPMITHIPLWWPPTSCKTLIARQRPTSITILHLSCTLMARDKNNILYIKYSFLLWPLHFPHRHYTHSQQPVHCTKPCGGHGQADGLPRYTRQCEVEDQRTQQGCRAAAIWMYPLLSEVFPLCLMGLGVPWRRPALLWTRGCSNCSQSLYSEGSRYMWVWHVYVLECRGCLWLCVYITQQIHACSDVYCVCSNALILLNTLMLALTTSVHMSTSTHTHTYMYTFTCIQSHHWH